jgi:isopenicillin N synthase-like dioxygenase
MAHEQIPVHKIDVAPFLDGTPSGRQSVIDAFDRAGRDSGFILLTGHGVAAAVIDRALDGWQAFFDLAPAEKLRSVPLPERDGLVGYTPFGSQALAYTAGDESPPDLMEAFSVGRDDAVGPFFDAHRDWFPPNIWPAACPQLRPAVTELEAALQRVADVVLRAMAGALELPEDWLVTRCERAVVTQRCNHYPGRLTAGTLAGQQRLGAHTDYGVMTLLVADPVPGLQIRRDERWWDVVPPAGTIVCNLGDMLSMWTNDRWVSTMHRVAPPPSPDGVSARRRSIARFVDGDPSLTIEPIPSCVAPGEAPRYPVVRAGEWLMAKIVGGQSAQSVALPNAGLTGATHR